MKKLFTLAILALVLLTLRSGSGIAQEGISGATLTIYSDIAVVEEVRVFSLSGPHETVELQGVPRGVVPDSVSFQPENPAVTVTQQEFVYEPITGSRLLDSFIGHEVEVTIPRTFGTKTVKGTLLGVEGGLILQDGSGKVQILPERAEITLPSLPRYAKVPTLRWRVWTDVPGEVRGRLSYLTGGLAWSAFYNTILDQSESQMAVNSWVTIVNQTGVTFEEAKVNLIAGQVQRRTPVPSEYEKDAPRPPAPRAAVAPQAQFEPPQAAFEYYQYELKEPATLRDKQRTQLRFLTAQGVPVVKRYVLEGGGPQVAVKFDLVNSEANQLGYALPAGLVRVYQLSATGMQLLGEDIIQHWAKDEKLTLTVGVAFDLKAERKVLEHRIIRRDERGQTTYRDVVEITLRNRKDQDVTIEVIEHLPGDWKILESSSEYEKLDAQRVLFKALVPAGGERKIAYTVEYSY